MHEPIYQRLRAAAAAVAPAQRSGVQRQTVFAPTIPGTILWDYAEDTTRVTDLYELAKAKAWNASQDVPWDAFPRNQHYPIAPECNPLRGFAGYEALPESEKLRISWRHHSLEISEILHGEQGALLIASQLVQCLPTVEAKLFAASQTFDEARHVEFFARYLQDIAGTVHEPSSELEALIELTLHDPRWDMKFIACQILIESLAMAKFQDIKAKCRVPTLQFAVGYIAKDEARHVNFGAEFLKLHLRELTASELQLRSDFVLDNVLKLANAMNVYTRVAAEQGWDETALRHHLRKFRIANPELSRNRFRQLLINLDAVGLLTQETRARLDALKVLG